MRDFRELFTWQKPNDTSVAAMELAKEAIRRAEVITIAQATVAAEFREVREALKERQANEQEWRESLGKRLDKQDEEAEERVGKISTLLYSGLGFLVLMLLGIIGFFLERLPIFK